jgi:hypothetical protein
MSAIVEQARRFGHYSFEIRADQPHHTRRDGFGPLGLLAQHQHWLAERRRLFLDSA